MSNVSELPKRSRGRPEGSKTTIGKLPPELKRLLSKLKGTSSTALDILISKMVRVTKDGEELTDEKIAEKILKLYFQAMTFAEDIKRAEGRKAAEKSTDEIEPQQTIAPTKVSSRFSTTVKNPSTGNVVQIDVK